MYETEVQQLIFMSSQGDRFWNKSQNTDLWAHWDFFVYNNRDCVNYPSPKFLYTVTFPNAMVQGTFLRSTFYTSVWDIRC